MAAHDMRFAQVQAPRDQAVLFPQLLDEVVGEDAPVRRLFFRAKSRTKRLFLQKSKDSRK